MTQELTPKKMSYGKYLKINDLLELQAPLSDKQEHNEMLFIIIHQSYELWFKQILHEVTYMQEQALQQDDLWRALGTLKRVLKILKVIVTKVDILETMTPLDYLTFRDTLLNSSGFQSVQFRQVELLLGIHAVSALKNDALDETEREQLVTFADRETIWETTVAFLQRRGIALTTPERHLRDGLIFDTDEHNQRLLIEAIKTQPEVAFLLELLVDLDEGIQEWRYRHVKMVERTIGGKMGTGGSTGVDYLKSTLQKHAFPDLWAIRNLI